MEKLKPNEILNSVKKKGFEQVWLESTNLIPKIKNKSKSFPMERGKSHPLFDLKQKLRQSFLDLGFTEVLNPIIIDEGEFNPQMF